MKNTQYIEEEKDSSGAGIIARARAQTHHSNREHLLGGHARHLERLQTDRAEVERGARHHVLHATLEVLAKLIRPDRADEATIDMKNRGV